jgi:hypothetical protein
MLNTSPSVVVVVVAEMWVVVVERVDSRPHRPIPSPRVHTPSTLEQVEQEALLRLVKMVWQPPLEVLLPQTAVAVAGTSVVWVIMAVVVAVMEAFKQQIRQLETKAEMVVSVSIRYTLT